MKTKWFTQTDYVDLDTGEIISKSRFEREDYYQVNINYKIEDCGAYKVKKYIKECRQRGQFRLEF